MIIVTGSKRSGTSMWMQILAAAGLPVIGERFPRGWGELIAAHNPDGYYESELAAGIYYRTNPHPLTGAYLFPEQTRAHAVKVFVPGLVRSDVAFLDRVIATVRAWREHAESVWRLRADLPGQPAEDPALALHPVLEWWTDIFALLRDLATRRYPAHVQSYQALLDDPERTIAEILSWIGCGDRTAAIAAVHTTRPDRPQPPPIDLPDGLDPAHLAAFDALYEQIHRGRPLTPTFIAHLNTIDTALRPLLLAHNARLRRAALDRLQTSAEDPPL